MKKSHSKKMDLAHVGTMVLGGAVGSKLSGIALPVIPEKFRPLLPVVLGVALIKSKNKGISSFGTGLMVVGAVKAVGSFVPSLGIGEPYALSDYRIEGGGDMLLNGTDGAPGMGYPAALSGVDAARENAF